MRPATRSALALPAPLLLLLAAISGQDKATTQDRRTEPTAAIKKDYEKAVKAFMNSYMKRAQSGASRAALEQMMREHPSKKFSDRFLAVVKAAPASNDGRDAAVWIVSNCRTYGAQFERSLEALATHHTDFAGITEAFRTLARAPSETTIRFLTHLEAKSTHERTRARACFVLAQNLQSQAYALRVHSLLTPDRRKFVVEYYGQAAMRDLQKADPKKLEARSAKYFEKIVKTKAYAHQKHGRQSTLGDAAKRYLRELRTLSVGMVAPEIIGEDIDGKPMRLSDYRGKVVVLDFWGDW